MRYVKVDNGVVVKYPFTGTDVIYENPQTSFPAGELSTALMKQYGGEPVIEVPAPTTPHSQLCEEGAPTLVGGQWTQTWVVRGATPAETDAKAAEVRAQRNQKLADTDWMVVKALESGTAVPADIAAKRQALRDITAQAGFPWDVSWPE